jgi:hypothetical protein
MPPVGTHVVERVERGEPALATLEIEKARNCTLGELLQALTAPNRAVLDKIMIFPGCKVPKYQFIPSSSYSRLSLIGSRYSE